MDLHKTPVAGEHEPNDGVPAAKVDDYAPLTFRNTDGITFISDKILDVSPTSVSGDPRRAQEIKTMYGMVLSQDTTDSGTRADDNCKPGAEVDEGNQYKRDRSGSKKRESKTSNRIKAKAAKKARKAQR